MPSNREKQIRAALHTALHGLSVGSDPLELLDDIAIVEGFAADVADARVADARASGAGWEEIARRLGVTRQAAHKRFAGTRNATRRKVGRVIEFRIERGRPPGR
jgi:hypothetical protein